MSRFFVSALVPALALAACAGELPGDIPPDNGGGRSSDEPPYDGGETAVRSEFDAAARAGTAEALRLFAQRHPQHALAAEALRRAAEAEGR